MHIEAQELVPAIVVKGASWEDVQVNIATLLTHITNHNERKQERGHWFSAHWPCGYRTYIPGPGSFPKCTVICPCKQHAMILISVIPPQIDDSGTSFEEDRDFATEALDQLEQMLVKSWEEKEEDDADL